MANKIIPTLEVGTFQVLPTSEGFFVRSECPLFRSPTLWTKLPTNLRSTRAQPLLFEAWDVSSVTDMKLMFYNAEKFRFRHRKLECFKCYRRVVRGYEFNSDMEVGTFKLKEYVLLCV